MQAVGALLDVQVALEIELARQHGDRVRALAAHRLLARLAVHFLDLLVVILLDDRNGQHRAGDRLLAGRTGGNRPDGLGAMLRALVDGVLDHRERDQQQGADQCQQGAFQEQRILHGGSPWLGSEASVAGRCVRRMRPA